MLLSQLEHHSNIVPWQLAGYEIDVVPLTGDGRIDLDAAERMASEEHAVVAFAHVSNVLGSILDARRAAEIAHKVGAKLLLDGCQAAPRLPVDVAAIGCRFLRLLGAQDLRANRHWRAVGDAANCSTRCRRGRAAGR